MSPEKQRELAARGGAAVPADKRSFSRDRALASDAGKAGGAAAPAATRSFSKDRKLATEAGMKGGIQRGLNRR
jgi:general stress protein YciG